MKESPYFKQAKLLLQVLPHIHKEKEFALKGGTALNFFYLEMPRLSVDIDLTFLPMTTRGDALKEISGALDRISSSIELAIPTSKIVPKKATGGEQTTKLFVNNENVQIKIEPNVVIRGAVFKPNERSLVKKAEDLFEVSVRVNVLSLADLYGGKICAALDRQHPRDFFDLKSLLEGNGLTDDIRKAFIVYLASHNRPMNELLSPFWKEIEPTFKNEFEDISTIAVTCDDLINIRDVLYKKLLSSITDNEKQFLISIKTGKPEWDLMKIDGIDKLPAIQWKILNIRKMSREKHTRELEKLRAILNL